MDSAFGKFMTDRKYYACSGNGQVSIEVSQANINVNGIPDVGYGVYCRIFSNSDEYGWKEDAIKGIDFPEVVFFERKDLAKAIDLAIVYSKKLGPGLRLGISAWAVRYVQFSTISIKWRALKKKVLRPINIGLKEYRLALLKEWNNANWSESEREHAQLFYDCAMFLS